MRLLSASTVGLSVASFLWSAIVAWGFFYVLEYESTPAEPIVPATTWPSSSSLLPEPNRLNLILAAHPRCPCTRATIDEFAELMAQQPHRIVAHVLVFKPSSSESGWERTAIWHRIATIRGTRIRIDDDGVEAKRFGLVTSGHALLYDEKGRLLFSGGLTNARGHAGDSVGRNVLMAILNDTAPEQTTTPVYGCSLFGKLLPSIERCSECRE